MEKILEFLVKWFLSAIVLCYYIIYKEGKIGFVELTGILVGTLIVLALWELIKWGGEKILIAANGTRLYAVAIRIINVQT